MPGLLCLRLLKCPNVLKVFCVVVFVSFLIYCMALVISKHRLLYSLVVECWLQVREVLGSIPSQGPGHTKDVIKMVPAVPLFGTEHLAFLKNEDRTKRTKNVMDKIWDRNPSKSEVIGRCGWDEKTNEKLNVKKNI